MKLISRIGVMIARPKCVFPLVKEEKMRKAWLYLLLVLFFANIPLLVVSLIVFNNYFVTIFPDSSNAIFRALFVTSILTIPNIVIVLVILFASMILQISLRVIKEKVKYAEILRIMIYALTPFILIFWLPPFSFGTFIWSVVLLARGLIWTYNVPKKKVLAVIIFYFLFGLLFGVIIYLVS
jgi:hypothetical protein